MGLVSYRADTPTGYYFAHSRRSMFDHVLSRKFSSLANLRFIQIGANDGALEDPLVAYIARFGWKGTMYEPLPFFCDLLRARYAGNPGVNIVNAAVHRESGDREIFFLPPDRKDLPEFTAGMGTFDRERIVAAAGRLGIAAQEIATRKVATVSWRSVLEAFGRQECDVLAIDTEGYDLEILKLIDFEEFRPQVIHFEHSHLTIDDRLAACKLLIAASYEMATWYGDTTAWRAS